MAINFPDNPYVGQSEYIAGIRYYFDGIGWTAAVSNTLGTRRSKEFIAQTGDYIFQTQFNLDNAELYINGIKIESTEYSVSADTYNASIILNEPILGTDIPVEIIAYGTYDILNEVYFRGEIAPENPLEGMLWFNTIEELLYIYEKNNWSEYKVGRYHKTSMIASAGQTEIAAIYDTNYVDVYLNGIKLYISEYTADNGTSVILNVPTSAGDILEVLSFTNTGTTYYPATETTDGLLSAEDKTKIDGFDSSINNMNQVISNLDTKYDPIGEAVALSIALG